MWPALFGALLGGVLALAGSLVVEIRKDRRRQLGAVRLILSQLRRGVVELQVLTVDQEATWLEGPHASIRTSAWEEHAADFVGLLDQPPFELVDKLHDDLAWASELGFTRKEGGHLIDRIGVVEKVLEPLSRPAWIDRHVLCL